jgi:integrase
METGMPKITKRTVDAAAVEKGGKDLFIWDAEIKGFGLKVTESGAKTYVLQYRTPEGRSRRCTIGRHGDPWTADEARLKAGAMKRDIAAGLDPLDTRAEARAALTVAELADLYLKEGPARNPNKKPLSWVADRAAIERHIKPLLGRKIAKSLTQADIEGMQRDIAAGKTAAVIKTKKQGKAIVRGGKGIASRVVNTAQAMLTFGVSRKVVSVNVAHGVKRYTWTKRERFLTAQEVGFIATAMTTMIAENSLNRTMADALRALMLTGCRRGEVRTLRWEWIDSANSCLRLPDSKTGAKIVPLGAAALQLLTSRPRVPGNPHVFPSDRNDGPITALQKVWKKVRTRATKIAEEYSLANMTAEPAPDLTKVRIHDLRHSYASVAAKDGVSLLMIAKVLGHADTRTTEIYAHLHNDPLRQVADRTSARIAEAFDIGAGQARPSAEVVPIRKAKRKA